MKAENLLLSRSFIFLLTGMIKQYLNITCIYSEVFIWKLHYKINGEKSKADSNTYGFSILKHFFPINITTMMVLFCLQQIKLIFLIVS